MAAATASDAALFGARYLYVVMRVRLQRALATVRCLEPYSSCARPSSKAASPRDFWKKTERRPFLLREACFFEGSQRAFLLPATHWLEACKTLARHQKPHKKKAWHCVRTPLLFVSQRAAHLVHARRNCALDWHSCVRIGLFLPAVSQLVRSLRGPLMWQKLSPSVKRLWLGAGGLFVAGNVFKYWTWVVAHDAVIKVEQEAHEDASRQLREARDSAQKYALPPLEK